MTDVSWTAGTALRMARQARELSQQQLAGMAGVTRQAVSALESGHSDPSLRVALALAGALGATIEELFGRGELADPVQARPVAPARPGERVALATIGDTFVALPLRGETAALTGFSAAGGLVPSRTDASAAQTGDILVRPIRPPRPTLVVAGCDPALPLLETPLALLDPPVAFAWWPCGSREALRLAAAGMVHAAGVHQPGHAGGYEHYEQDAQVEIPGGAETVGFTSWREGLVARAATGIRGLDDVASRGLRMVNREPGAQARALLDQERLRLRLDPAELPGYDGQAAGHLQVASTVAGGVG